MNAEDVIREVYEDDGGPDIVEWYETRPITVSTAVATGSVLGAFALGALAAIGAMALISYLDA